MTALFGLKPPQCPSEVHTVELDGDNTHRDAEFASPGLGQQALRGAFALGARQVVVVLTNLAGAVLLARAVSPSVFGVYVVASAVLTFFTLTADGGLAASLVRQQDEPQRQDMRSIFTVQLGFTCAIAVLLAGVAPAVAHLLRAPPGTGGLLRLTAAALLINCFRTIPVAIMERRLRFGTIGVINAMETVVFNVVAVTLAYRGHGAASFGIALVGEAVFGAVASATAQRCWLLPTVHVAGVRERLPFGVPYQASAIISSLKDSVSPAFIGPVAGTHAVGLIEWSNTLAAYPLYCIMVLQRLFMPTFARLQHDRRAMGRALESVIQSSNMVVAPLCMLTLVLAHDATPVVFGAKWSAALPYFYLLWTANLGVPTASPIVSMLNACGRSKVVLAFSVGWMVGTWLLSVPLVLALGPLGFGIANVCIQTSAILLVRVAREEVPFSVLPVIWRSWVAAGVAGGLVGLWSLTSPPHTLVALVLEGGGGMLLYAGISLSWQREFLSRVRTTLRPRQPGSVAA